jgi:hypothetical protein
VLKVSALLLPGSPGSARLRLALEDPQGRPVRLSPDTLGLAS